MKHWRAALTAAALLAAPSARADILSASADSIVVQYKSDVAFAKADLWARLAQPSLWWSPDHTYSHIAANMSLKLTPGGCWCEMWKGGAVEHGRVIAIVPEQLLRLDTALGPLQELGVKGALSFEIADAKTAGHSTLTMTYRVTGGAASKLDALSGPVDRVLGEQFQHLTQPDAKSAH